MKNLFLCATVFVMVLMTVSCKKEDHQDKAPIAIDINVTLKQNESYSYNLPLNKSDEAYKIIVDAQHASLSYFMTGCFSSTPLSYFYLPAKDFAGLDKVVISNVEDEQAHHDGSHHGGGMCGKDDDEQSYIITIVFDIQKSPDSKTL